MSNLTVLPPNLRSSLESMVGEIDDLVLYVNSSCNLRCKHCYLGNELLSSAQRLDGDSIVDFLGEFPSLSRITILGGEPFMHPEINKIVKAACANNIHERRITTNLVGYFKFDPSLFRDCELRLAVSIDGYDALTHEKIRGPGTFHNTCQRVRDLLDQGYDLEVTHTVNSENIANFPLFLELCRNLGISKLNLHKISAHGNATENLDLLVSAEEWVSFTRDLEASARLSSASDRSIHVRYPKLYVTDTEYDRLLERGEYWNHSERSYYSKSGGHRVVVFADGRFFISSELFGSDCHVGYLKSGAFVPNPDGEHALNVADQSVELNTLLSSDFDQPDEGWRKLSVSYKRDCHIE